jgi:8-oxo-dGTP diphosphatase
VSIPGPGGARRRPSSELHVVAAAIIGSEGRVLIARRPDHLHQGGLWEFPGGKLEPGEAAEAGLARELDEELGLTPTAMRPLIRVHHRYPERDVLLDVWRVEAWGGEPHGREGQPLEWVAAQDLTRRPFPAANLPIVTAVRLPDRYLITPDPGPDDDAFLAGVERSLAGGARLVQLRAKALAPPRLAGVARGCLERCRDFGARLILNADPGLSEAVGADGVHLSASRLLACRERPLGASQWVAASCHDARELAHACRIGVDFVVLSPVRRTSSHPDATPLGWRRFWVLTESASVPVYALGGLGSGNLATAWAHGAQGIAGIRGLWQGADP